MRAPLAWISGLRPRSFQTQLVLVMAGLVVTALGVSGWLTYTSARNHYEFDMIQAASMTVDRREQELKALVARQHERVRSFLQIVRAGCLDNEPERAQRCVQRVLEHFARTEGASAALLQHSGRTLAEFGEPADWLSTETRDDPSRVSGLVQLSDGEHQYIVEATAPGGLHLQVRFPIDLLSRVFLQPHPLGDSGETFLIDQQGNMVAPLEAATAVSTVSEPIRQCLAGADGVELAIGHRDEMAIHGFRHLETLGGACAVAYLPRAESLQPIRRLQLRFILLALIFGVLSTVVAVALSRRLARPLVQLAAQARILEQGDLIHPVAITGPAELQAFATSFANMARSLRESGDALRESESRNREVLKQALDAVVGMNADGNVIAWNLQAEHIFGRSRDEALGWPMADLIIPERYHEAHWHGLRRFLDTGEGPILNHRIEITALHADGTEFPVELTVMPLLAQRKRVFYAFIRDLTEAKRLQAEHERAEETQRFLGDVGTLLAESLNPAIIVDRLAHMAVPRIADLCVVSVIEDGELQPAACAYRDVEQESWITDEIRQYRRLPDVPLAAEQAIVTGEPQLIQSLSSRRLQALRQKAPALRELLRAVQPISVMAVPLKAGGSVIGVISLISCAHSGRLYRQADLAFAEEFARRCASALENARLFERAQAAVQLRDEFLSIASHELNTPLTTLQLQLHMLARKAPQLTTDPEARDWLEQRVSAVLRQSGRLQRLVDELLDISRIAGGRLRLQTEPVDLAAVIRQVTEDFVQRGTFEHAVSRLRLDVESGVTGHWDRMRLEQIASNLISNALKYGGEGEVTVTVSGSASEAVLTVSDRGPGIPPEEHERIFGRFERSASARHYGGLGLGLYIVRQVVEAMGGTISIDSRPDEGATFIVRLPLTAPEGDASSPSP